MRPGDARARQLALPFAEAQTNPLVPDPCDACRRPVNCREAALYGAAANLKKWPGHWLCQSCAAGFMKPTLCCGHYQLDHNVEGDCRQPKCPCRGWIVTADEVTPELLARVDGMMVNA